jgi:hypothetical protein
VILITFDRYSFGPQWKEPTTAAAASRPALHPSAFRRQ